MVTTRKDYSALSSDSVSTSKVDAYMRKARKVLGDVKQEDVTPMRVTFEGLKSERIISAINDLEDAINFAYPDKPTFRELEQLRKLHRARLEACGELHVVAMYLQQVEIAF